ncbi:uncharacterized protein LOC114239877 [Bombyx mandarina]|uniref:Uncharacterized protein n=2 Tax=Bombyx TaxID=7090 RepID=A0A8R2HS31_BOMMO|nr:uncharacterized protein LOC110386588 [Bombyx mori]XP_028026095.1 uncharacterized protein LOC114239877 [Bombyx mandarina]
MLKLFILLFALLAPARPYLLPKRRSQPQTTTAQVYFPPELRRKGQKALIDLKIPNKLFCAEMQLQPSRQYMVLPWWYNYCQQFEEMKEKKYMNSVYYLPTYRNILNRVKVYKNLKRLSDQKMRDLQRFEMKNLL